MAPSDSRFDRILAELHARIAGVLETDISEIDVHEDFLEMGADSIVLVDAIQGIETTYGMKVSIRQLFEETTNLSALAAYIDENLPEDRSEDVATSTPIAAATSAPVPPSTPAPPQQPAPQVFVSPTAPQVPPQPVAAQPVAAQPVAAQPAAPQYAPPPAVAPQHPVSINGLEGFLQQQLETVSRTLSGVVGQQLALLGQQAIAPQAPVQQSVSAPVASPPSQPETPAPVQAQAPASARVEQPAPPQPPAQPSPPAASQAPASASEEEAPRAYHPYRMLKADTSDKADIDARQTAHREALIERFVARTKASRESVRQARPFLADSRAAMGFRFSTKEMLYPLTGSVSKGSRVLDLDGNEYIDITMGQGVDLLGHQPDFVQRALEDQLAKGIHLNPRWEELGEYARLLCELTGMDRVALTNSGTEAVMTAMRLARNATGRRKIVIFEGSYHGHSDGTLAASPGLGSDHAIPVAPGTPPGAVEDVIILPYGTDESLAEIRRLAPQLAAVLAEPVQSRFPDLQPREFLHQVRAITREHGALMVFDEMLTGFRSNLGGAQVVYGIQVDLATYGKVIGGGMPIGAVAGRGAIMDGIDGGLWDFGDRSYPAAERVFFGGTFCFHPLAMAGGLATLRYLRDAGPSLQEELNRKTALLVGELNDFFRAGNVPIHIATFGSLFRFMFKTNLDLFFYHLLEKGIYLWEGRNCFLSTAHSDADIAHIKEAIMATVEDLYEGGYLPTATLTPRDRPRDPLWPPLPDFQLKVQGASLEGRRIATRTKQLERAGGDAPARGFWERHRGAERPLPNMNLPERHGIDFSLFYFGTYPSEASPNKYNLLLDGARFGDANDFRAVWVPERHFHSFGGFSPNPSVVCAALARETQRLRLRAGSVVLPLHHPVRVAEEWAVVDNLSGGRVDISFASGWHPDDFVFAPENFGEHRELMFSEIDTVRRLWQGESVVAEGGNGARVDLTLHPMPIQKDLQTWITIVNNPDTYARAGAIGSGVLTNLLGQSLDELTSNIARYRHELEQAGLDPAQGHVTVMLHTFIGPDAELAIEQARQPFYDYLLNCVGLFENLVKTLGFKIDPANLAEDDRAFLLEQAYNRYVQDAALIGSPESCAPIIERILAAGADEIACFIDFGVDPDLAAAALPDLNRLRAMFADRKRGERPAAPPKSVPMSEAQRQLWVLRRLSQAADMAYTDPVRLHLRGPIDAAVMNRAVNTVVARHEALRARLNGEEPDWLVHERLSHPLPLIDLRGMDNGATSWFEQESACPIDLVGQGPLRTALLRLADDEHILAVRTHHILVDGWSAAVILDELRACYDALVRGRLPDLPEPIDFSAFQARRDASLAEESMIAQRSWWRDQLGSRPPHTVLPDDFSRGANKSWSGGRFSRQLNARETAAIKQLARAHRCTPFMASMTLFGGLVSRLTGQERVLIGLPVAGRSAAEGCMIGYFTHLLPVQLDMPGSATAAELLDRTRRSLLAAFDHQDYPFAQLIRDLELTQSGPLVSMTFNMDQPIHLPNLACLDTRILPETIQYARFDFSINITEIDGCYALAFDYSKEAYEDDTAVRWANRFHHLLHGVLADPHGPLAAISMADESELSLLLSRFNDTATEPPGQTLHMRLAELAERLGDTVALVDALTGDETSFSQLHHQALAQAALLREQGIRPGQVVAILMDRSPEAIVAMLATLHCGAAYLPLDPAMPISRLRFMLLDAGAALIQTSSYHQGQAEDIAEGLPILWVIGTGDGFSLPGVPEQSAYIMYTSGSTGQPKGVMVPHAAITRLVHDPGYIQVSEGDVFLGHAPMSFDAATFEIWAPLFHGARLVILPQRIPSLDELVDALTRFQVTWLWLPAALFSLLASRPAPAGHRPRAVFTGGEAMSPAALAMCRNNWPGMRIVNIYGPTENTTFSTWFDTEGWDTRHVSVPIGSPIGDTSAYVVTPDLRPAVAGDGELWLGGVGLASGYLGRPALTAERFVPHPFSDQPGERLYRSGDLVRFVWHQERPVIEFRGRADRQVKLRGFRIELDEIAATLERNPGVAQSAVTLDLSAKSPRLVAYVVPSAGDLEAKHLSLWLADHLPEYMVPGHYVALDRLPLNARGKLDRDALPAPEPDDAERQGTPPANRLEREMAEIWAEVLDTDQIFRESNFFELGGHSLTATRVVSRIKERFGLELSLADFFATPFISDLAANVLAAGGTLQVTQADQDLEREEIEI